MAAIGLTHMETNLLAEDNKISALPEFSPGRSQAGAYWAVALGVVVVLLYPLVASFMLPWYDPQEACEVAGFYGSFRQDLFPPMMRCGVDEGEFGHVITPFPVILSLSAMFCGGVALIILGLGTDVFVGVRRRDLRAAESARQAMGRRYGTVSVMLMVVSVISLFWVWAMRYGLFSTGSAVPDPRERIAGYVVQLIAACLIPASSIVLGVLALSKQRFSRPTINRETSSRAGRKSALYVPLIGILLSGTLLAMTLSSGILTISATADRGPVPVLRTTDTESEGYPGDQPDRPVPSVPPGDTGYSEVPSVAVSPEDARAAVLRLAELARTAAGPLFAAQHLQEELGLDPSTPADPAIFDVREDSCGELRDGKTYTVQAEFTSSDSNTWDVAFDASATSMRSIAIAWSGNFSTQRFEKDTYGIVGAATDAVREARVAHRDVTVSVSISSLCVAQPAG